MISTLLFDFGDVFLNLDKNAAPIALEKLGLKEFSEEMIEINKKYEVGRLTSKEFIDFYRQKLPHASTDSLKQAWNSTLINFPEHRLQFLQELHRQKKFKLILFSNTNDLHISWVREHVALFEHFKNCFDAFYLSHEINLRKPNTASFQFILKEQQLKPDEVLFIDDTEENTVSAKKLGIHVWNIDPGTEDVTELFMTKKELL